MRAHLLSTLLLLPVASPGARQEQENVSGAEITKEERAYDVVHYDLALRVDPATKSIRGVLTLRARVVAATGDIALALDSRLDVSEITSGLTELGFAHLNGRLLIQSPALFQRVGSEFEIAIAYGGVPLEAARPPWQGGFTWARTASGEPWIATSCQGEGADLWWPCKDQPSDEPESMDLHITVPESLIVASNGRLASVVSAGEGWQTFNWHVSTPINNYGVALNIAPYSTIEAKYESVAGETFMVTYWVLPENVEKGEKLFQEILEHMAFFEEIFGPYPFRADKYGVVETPHLGMEHQSIIAYGNEYRGNPWGKQFGFDFLHHHEFAHEWWANLVTAPDWSDYWIHESFATYAQALYVERLHGYDAYLEEMESNRVRVINRAAIAPRESRSTRAMYSDGPGAPGGDIYFKGSWVLHTLRWLLGDEAFFLALRRMAYPDPEMEKVTDGSQCRFATTDDILAIAEKHSGRELAWFFEVYLRQPALPELVHEVRGDSLHLSWKAPGDRAFPMPVQVRVGDELVVVEVPKDGAIVRLGAERDFELDPHHRILKAAAPAGEAPR